MEDIYISRFLIWWSYSCNDQISENTAALCEIGLLIYGNSYLYNQTVLGLKSYLVSFQARGKNTLA